MKRLYLNQIHLFVSQYCWAFLFFFLPRLSIVSIKIRKKKWRTMSQTRLRQSCIRTFYVCLGVSFQIRFFFFFSPIEKKKRNRNNGPKFAVTFRAKGDRGIGGLTTCWAQLAAVGKPSLGGARQCSQGRHCMVSVWRVGLVGLALLL